MNEAQAAQAAVSADWALIWSIIFGVVGIVVTMIGATWILGRLLGGLQTQAKQTKAATEAIGASINETRSWVEGLVTTLHNQHNELDRRVTRVETKIEHVPGSGTRYEQAHKGA
ncbi:hypothetical protein GYB59_15270 [bacterium]|nr:hypothetical protein [bacterium]